MPIKTLAKIILIIVGVAASTMGIGYSMDLASSKSSLAFLGWVGFILSIYIFWLALTKLFVEDKPKMKKHEDGPLPSSKREEELGSDPASVPNNRA